MNAYTLTPHLLSAKDESLCSAISHLLGNSLRTILRRQTDKYPFIDTKFSLVSGEEFPDDESARSRGVIYPWIQGRGLEAFAEHARWLRAAGGGLTAAERTDCLDRIERLLPKVIESMETARRRNKECLPFMMTAEGAPLTVGADGRVRPEAEAGVAKGRSMSDLFYAKGLLLAANYLDDHGRIAEAVTLWDEVVEDLRHARFHLGQIALDPRNPVQAVPGRFSHAGRMIAIGGTTSFYRQTKEARYAELGLEFIEHVLENYSAENDSAGFAESRAGDCWEFIGIDGRPWRDSEGRVWSDPGHAIEFVGLSLAHLRATGMSRPDWERRCLQILRRNFENGFAQPGLVKSFDLVTRRAINTDMPWWSLPEAMRAAKLSLDLAEDPGEQAALSTIFTTCWESFTQHYVRPERGGLAVQGLAQDGRVSRAIPAMPDADPCYHTGLSLLACLC